MIFEGVLFISIYSSDKYYHLCQLSPILLKVVWFDPVLGLALGHEVLHLRDAQEVHLFFHGTLRLPQAWIQVDQAARKYKPHSQHLRGCKKDPKEVVLQRVRHRDLQVDHLLAMVAVCLQAERNEAPQRHCTWREECRRVPRALLCLPVGGICQASPPPLGPSHQGPPGQRGRRRTGRTRAPRWPSGAPSSSR